MKNMFSPYQQRKNNIIPTIYSKVDIVITKEKITKLERIISSKKESIDRVELAKKMLITQRNNFEFISRQLNQQNLERV